MSWCCLTVLCRFLSPQKVCVGVGVYEVLARGELAPVMATLNCGDFNHYLERAIHHSVVCSLVRVFSPVTTRTDWLTLMRITSGAGDAALSRQLGRPSPTSASDVLDVILVSTATLPPTPPARGQESPPPPPSSTSPPCKMIQTYYSDC